MKYISLAVCLIYLLGKLIIFPGDNDVIVMLDVGQGSSLFVSYNGFKLLVDTGFDRTASLKLGRYLSPFENVIDLVIITHPHLDHFGGFAEVDSRYKVNKVVVFPVCYKSDQYEKLLALIGERLLMPWELSLEISGLEINVLHPTKRIEQVCPKGESGMYLSDENINNDSIVLSIETSLKSLLITGDTEFEKEAELIESGVINREYDYYIAGHHCSETSTSERLLDIVSPAFVYCSYGEGNRYGHPGESTLERIEESGASVYNTSEDGDVHIGMF
jgi:competence protein ComEC